MDTQQLLFAAPSQLSGTREEPSSVNTDDLPRTEDFVGEEPNEVLFAMNVIRPPAARGGDRRDRPGWVNRRDTVCYQCYAVNKHIAPECDLQLHELGKVVANYEALTPANRDLVPKAAYSMAKHFAKVNGATQLPSPQEEGDQSPSKN